MHKRPITMDEAAKAYWFFFTPTAPWPGVPFTPPSTASPTPTQGPVPVPEVPLVDIVLNAQLPQYDDPNWWTKPFDISACVCCAYYSTWEVVLVHTAGDSETTLITGISYEAPGLPDLAAFQVQVLRDGQVMTDFTEIKVDAANPNPAKQFAFGGHTNQLPVWIRLDRNQTLTVRVKLLGVYPYPLGPSDLYSGDICVFLHGLTTMVFDNRDGAPRPNESGALAQAQLSGGPVGEYNPVDADQLSLQMQAYLRFMLSPNPAGLGS